MMPGEEASIMVKSVGNVAFLPLFSLSPPASGPMLSKTLIFVHVIVLICPNNELREWGGGGGGRGQIFSKREILFWSIKMDYCLVVQPSQLLLSVTVDHG